MSEVTLYIDDEEVKVPAGTTVLEAARKLGIDIPTLCDHPRLSPFGACRLCTVEIVSGKRSRLVASCSYPVESGLVVMTESEPVVRGRKMLLELMWARAPGVQPLRKYGLRYGIQGVQPLKPAEAPGVDGGRFKSESTFCILCGLCVRYCAEVKGKNAIGFVGRGTEREVMFFPEIACKECPGCKECYGLCPTGTLPSHFALAEALSTR